MGRLEFCLKLDIGELLSSRFSKSNTPVEASRQISSRPLFLTKTLRKFYSDLSQPDLSTAATLFPITIITLS